MNYHQTLRKLEELERQKQELESTLQSLVMGVIKEIASENPINRLGSNCFIVRSSDMIGNPWNPEFYDWEAAGKILVNRLLKISPSKWKEHLSFLLEGDFDSGKSVYVVVGVSPKYRVPLNRKFISKILDKL